jgi:hypothetical protein
LGDLSLRLAHRGLVVEVVEVELLAYLVEEAVVEAVVVPHQMFRVKVGVEAEVRLVWVTLLKHQVPDPALKVHPLLLYSLLLFHSVSYQ